MRDYSSTELNTAIDEWIVGANAQRNRAILKSRLIDGLTFDEASKREIQRLADKMESM